MTDGDGGEKPPRRMKETLKAGLIGSLQQAYKGIYLIVNPVQNGTTPLEMPDRTQG
jgi:hypothetical protein